MKNKAPEFNDGWCFAIVNGRLAEISFDAKYGIWGHCYVERREYTRRERRMIDADIKKYNFIFRKGYYIDKKLGLRHKAPSIYKVFPDIKKYKNKRKRIHQEK